MNAFRCREASVPKNRLTMLFRLLKRWAGDHNRNSVKLVLTALPTCVTQAAGWEIRRYQANSALQLNRTSSSVNARWNLYGISQNADAERRYGWLYYTVHYLQTGSLQLSPNNPLINGLPRLERSFVAIPPALIGSIVTVAHCSQVYAIALGAVVIVTVVSFRWLVRKSVRLFNAALAFAKKYWEQIRQPEVELTTALNRTTEKLQASQLALQQQEAKLAQVQRVAHVGSWELDLNAGKLTWSAELIDICGLEPGAQTPNAFQSLRLIHPDDLAQIKQALKSAFKDGLAFQLEHRLIRADGLVRYVNSSGQAIASHGGTKKLFGTVMDITERKQTERERDNLLKSEQNARQLAEAANRNKDRLFALLSHELKTPLNPILGWSQIMQQRSFSENLTKQALETIERNAKVQLQLIDDLLDFSQLLRGQLTLSYSSVNLIAVITAVIKQVQIAADAKSITIKPMFDPTIGAIRGDLKRLQQVVGNLLSNAVKFSPEGSEVEVTLQQVNNQAQIIVKDRGRGIEPEFLSQIFNDFSQEDSSSTRKFGGFGLGLAIVHYLVELHGGTITATSPGIERGATFTVSLPLSSRIL